MLIFFTVRHRLGATRARQQAARHQGSSNGARLLSRFPDTTPHPINLPSPNEAWKESDRILRVHAQTALWNSPLVLIGVLVVSSASLIMHVIHEASRRGSYFFFCALPLVTFTIPV